MHIMWIKASLNSGIKTFFFSPYSFSVSYFFFCHFGHTSPTHSSKASTRCKCTLWKRLQHISVRRKTAWILHTEGGGGGRLRVLPVGNTLQVARTISGDYWWHVKVGQSGDSQGRPGCKHAPAARPPLIFSTRRRGVQMHLCHLCQVFPGAPCDSPRRGSGCAGRWEHLWPLIRRAQWHAHLSNRRKEAV